MCDIPGIISGGCSTSHCHQVNDTLALDLLNEIFTNFVGKTACGGLNLFTTEFRWPQVKPLTPQTAAILNNTTQTSSNEQPACVSSWYSCYTYTSAAEIQYGMLVSGTSYEVRHLRFKYRGLIIILHTIYERFLTPLGTGGDAYLRFYARIS